MALDPSALQRLRAQKQAFFLPYYIETVARHPAGIDAARVKSLVAAQILQEFGIDISDPDQTGLNPSTSRSSASQWANNLISNSVLDEFMLVVRMGGRAILYPGATDNSRTVLAPGKALTVGQVGVLDRRGPSRIENRSGPTFRRSLQLAEYVRGLNGRACAVGGPSCVVFDGRDGRPYVEVHHIIPMAAQGQTLVNLDRSRNMAPVCPGCHSCVHRGRSDLASAVLDEVFAWYESVHHVTFQEANDDVDFDTTSGGLLAMYGADVIPEQ
jgi:hypothetical protein